MYARIHKLFENPSDTLIQAGRWLDTAMGDALKADHWQRPLATLATGIVMAPPHWGRISYFDRPGRAARIVVILWLLTDERDLSRLPTVTALQRKPFGSRLDPFAGEGSTVGRAWVRDSVIRPFVERWDTLAEAALRVLEPAAVAATTPEPAAGAGGEPQLKPPTVAEPRKPRRGDAGAMCLACLISHPHWTNKQIAEDVGINPASITKERMPKFFHARGAMEGDARDLPSGKKNADEKDCEAVFEENGGVNSPADDDDNV